MEWGGVGRLWGEREQVKRPGRGGGGVRGQDAERSKRGQSEV